MFWIGFMVGLVIGGAVGLFVFAIISANGRDELTDEHVEYLKNKLHE